MEFEQPTQPPQTNGYVIAVVICIVIGILYYWLSPYFYKLVEYIDTIRSMIDLIISFSSNVGESVVDETAQGAETVVKSVSRPPKEKKAPAPDDSSSSVQSSPTSTNGQYCYVGEWKGIRSCAKVGKSSCKGQTYSTEELCVNPNLRP